MSLAGGPVSHQWLGVSCPISVWGSRAPSLSGGLMPHLCAGVLCPISGWGFHVPSMSGGPVPHPQPRSHPSHHCPGMPAQPGGVGPRGRGLEPPWRGTAAGRERAGLGSRHCAAQHNEALWPAALMRIGPDSGSASGVTHPAWGHPPPAPAPLAR